MLLRRRFEEPLLDNLAVATRDYARRIVRIDFGVDEDRSLSAVHHFAHVGCLIDLRYRTNLTEATGSGSTT